MTRRRAMLGLAALDQLHAQQMGVKMGYGQPSFDETSTRWVSPAIPIGTDDFTIEYYGNTFGSSLAGWCALFNAAQPVNYAPGCLMAYPNPLGSNGVMSVIFEGGGLTPNFYAEPQQAFHFVLTRSGRTMTVYINNVVKATTEMAAVADFADFRMGLANSSFIGHCRMFNYALSASEVEVLYNAGKPEERVLPTVIKDRTPVRITDGSSYTWTGEASDYYSIAVTSRPFTEGQTYKIKVTVSDFVSGAPFILLGASDQNNTIGVPSENGTHELYGTFRGGFILGVLFYGGLSGTDRRLKLTIDSIEPVGCVAEWLPQNLSVVRDLSPNEIEGANSYTWTGEASDYYSIAVTSRPFTEGQTYKVKVTVSDFVSGAPFILLGSSGQNNPITVPPENGTHELYGTFRGGFVMGVLFYGGMSGTDRRLTLTIDSITAVDNIAAVWLDSARQLPANDEFLPPMWGSLGGYDMAANGTPEVLMKPVLRRMIDVDPMSTSDIYAALAWDSDQTDATDRREGGKMVANCGSTYKYSRPMLYITGANFELGKKYVARLTYTLISGSVRIAAFGNWSDGAVEQVQQTFDTQLKQYEYTTPMLSYNMEQPTFNRLYFYLGSAAPDSQFTIDRITIYEYE